jgi:PAS domain S-box-containing protein
MSPLNTAGSCTSRSRQASEKYNNDHVHSVVAALNDVFAGVPHVMFCVKGPDRRYLAANQAFAERAGRNAPGEVLGTTADDLFPADLAATYAAQDERLLADGEPIRNELELILRPDGSRGWYVTTKTRLLDEVGGLVGIVAVSYDLRTGMDTGLQGLQAAIDTVRRRFAEPLKVADLADAAGMSATQLERSLRKAVGMSPKQLLIRVRLDEAIRRLDEGDLPLATIAGQCGFYDQSSFTRQFQRAVGMTPGAYRARGARR